LKGKITIHYGNQENCSEKGNQEVGRKESRFEEPSEKDDSEEDCQEGNQEILRREEIYKVSAAVVCGSQ
jgi:hypothetical protein